MVIHSAPQDSALDSGQLLADVRRVFASGRTLSLRWRLDQLRGIERLVEEREPEIAAALAEDLGRSAMEVWLGDIASTKAEAAYARRHVRNWMRRRRASLRCHNCPAGRGCSTTRWVWR
jgi:aldehyde dehydrogenase (NAD+)